MNTIDQYRNTITCADALAFTQNLPDDSVHCVVTSIPYYGLRAYLDDNHPDKALEMGLEDTPRAYIERMVTLFREIRRVLRPDGVVWLNVGDSYVSSPSGKVADPFAKSTLGIGATARVARNASENKKANYDLPEKNLLLMPHRLAIALQDDGYIVRQDNVWAKDSPMPESVTDRTTRAHEYIFQLVKSGDYWYDADAIREANIDKTVHKDKGTRGTQGYSSASGKNTNPQRDSNGGLGHNPNGRNKRSVWRLKSEPFSGAHFATFPTELPRVCILAGCPEKTCPQCGKGWVREVEAIGGTIGKGWTDHSHDLEIGMTQAKYSGGVGNARNGNGEKYQRIDKGFHPACSCGCTETQPGIVFDPFMGSGTTALVARQLGRDYIGSELNAEYIQIATDRLRMPFEKRIAAANNDLSDLPLFQKETI